MDNSTDGVTLISGFLFDIVGHYKDKQVFEQLAAMTAAYDENNPTKLAPMALYNELCGWVEQHLGKASIETCGENVGARAYDRMIADGTIGSKPTPLEILRALAHVASLLIKDPKGRGWEIVAHGEGWIRMRRTQTFNCSLQEGLLRSLVTRTGVKLPAVDHATCTRNGAEFCEYEITWRP